MATIVLTALGTIFGGPLGAVLGAAAGSQIDSALIGKSSRQGPRLKDLSITTSSYGSAVPRYYGHMRAAGTIIWATDLIEHSATSGGGKSSPSVTTYSYTSSFAVALSSRPIQGIGRVWADGKLLRGTYGDLKVGGALRVYTGQHDQGVDPLIAAAEGSTTCPAFRGLAYAVFEDLQLADFGNRIPSLSFEIFADEDALSLGSALDGLIDSVDADVPLDGITGFACEGALDETLAQFQPLFPMLCDAGGDRLTITRERLQVNPIALGEPAVAQGKGEFGATTGFSHSRQAGNNSLPGVLRYYDTALDYQPGTQRAPGKPASGQPRTVEVPAAISAQNAFQLIASANRGAGWAQETLQWRCGELHPSVAPGTVVTVPGRPGLWRVTEWEWRETGVELLLKRLAPDIQGILPASASGQSSTAPDLVSGPTALHAFELPWDGNGSSDLSVTYVAAGSASSGWSGAALYADHGDGALIRLGATGRMRRTIGTAQTVLPSASPLMLDRQSTLTVHLAGTDLALTGTTTRQLAMGANRALVGQEIIQFLNAESMGDGNWRLSGLWRGCGGTEFAISTHAAGEPFVLLDGNAVALDATLVGKADGTQIAALGLGDTTAVYSPIWCRGIALRPLSPVHPKVHVHADGSLELGWTRRARGAWLWQDGIEVPLQEETELYQITFGDQTHTAGMWESPFPKLTLDSATRAALNSALPNGRYTVRQKGKYALSKPLLLASAA
ncbi:hypothetical protein GTZ99_14180 [Novosphingobium sp. FSY-8]|uniref:Tail protein n=1 Tax=Novosphingobium ovatum TaxID=1908523 RepID=A0ABW9XGW2_9SPHN|nr:phage tail protein [Novosphingobium ovatum]NBC37699.1 hypothetical protein [Novosphingobium ovatum]